MSHYNVPSYVHVGAHVGASSGTSYKTWIVVGGIVVVIYLVLEELGMRVGERRMLARRL